MRRPRPSLAALALLASLALSGAASAQSSGGANDAEALAALRSLISDPRRETPPILSTYGFEEAQYLVDGLTRNEMFRLQALVRDYGVDLPSGILTALRLKAPTGRPNRG